MKKIISLILSFVMVSIPMLSSNCFALSDSASSIVKSTTVNVNKDNKSRYSSCFFKGLKGAAVAGLTVATLAIVINSLNLSDSVGRLFRLSYDYLVNSVGLIPEVAKKVYNSFSKPNEIKVFSDVSCPGTLDSWFLTKNTKCLNAIIERLKEVYNNNSELLGDNTLKYDLVFKRV